MNCTISIIVPVYNMEQYLRKCLDSIMAQTFKDFECWLIDDGSTDRSSAICDDYVAKDTRFHVVHKENGGLASARQCGIDHATGEYIANIDPDDWVDADYLENLIVNISKTGGVIVNCAYVEEDGKEPKYAANQPTGTSAVQLIQDCLTHRVHASLWSKLIPRSVFCEHGVRFPEYGFYEDMFVTVSALQFVKSVVHVPRAAYHYRINPNSLTHVDDRQRRIELDMEFMHNMERLDALYHLSANPQLKGAFDRSINFVKTNTIRAYYSHYDEIKPSLSHFPKSYKLRYCRSLKDFLYYLAGRYGVLFPFRIYNFFR